MSTSAELARTVTRTTSRITTTLHGMQCGIKKSPSSRRSHRFTHKEMVMMQATVGATIEERIEGGAGVAILVRSWRPESTPRGVSRSATA